MNWTLLNPAGLLAGVAICAVAVTAPVVFHSSSLSPEKLDASTVQVILDAGWGSGVVVGDGTFILTAKHVATGKPSEIEVKDSTGKVQKAKVVWVSPTDDVALLKVQEPLPPAPVSCDVVSKGDKVRVVGYPNPGVTIPLAHTEGIVVSFHPQGLAEIPGEAMMIIDANIWGGNSGGPVFNEEGEVIGIAIAAFVGWDVQGSPVNRGYQLVVPTSYICDIVPGEF